MKKLAMAAVLSALVIACNKQPGRTRVPSDLPERIILDTPYGADAAQKMDVYLPEKRSRSTKVVVLVHGGAWYSGDKTELSGIIPTIRAKWPECAVVNINYRLANGRTVVAKDMLDDISNAVEFISKCRDSFVISESYAMLGTSAGAQLSLLYTYNVNFKNRIKCVSDLYGPCIVDDWDWYNSYNVFLGRPIKELLVNYTGKTWEADSNLYKNNSPYTLLNATNARPTIIFHGTVDAIVPLYHSQWLSAKLKSVGAVSEYYEYPLDGHGFNAYNNEDCLDKSIAFFKANMR